MGHFNKLYDKNYQEAKDTKLKYGYTDSWSDYHDYFQFSDDTDSKDLCQETYKTEECKADGYGIPSTNNILKTQTQNNIKG
jgi:hypothetical protein